MKRVAVLFLLAMVFTTSLAFALDGPPVDFDKLNNNAEKRFHVKKEGWGFVFSEGRTKPYPGAPEDAAEKFIREYHRMLKVSDDLKDIKFDRKTCAKVIVPDMNRITRVSFNQYYKEVRVSMAGLLITMDGKNRVIDVISSIREIDNGFSVDPIIKQDEIQDALQNSYPEYGSLSSAVKLFIEYYNDSPVLVYRFSTSTGENHDKKAGNLSMDANTGEVLKYIRFNFNDPEGDESHISSDQYFDKGTVNKTLKETIPLQQGKARLSGIIQPRFGVERNPNAIPMTITIPPEWKDNPSIKSSKPQSSFRTLTEDESRQLRESRGIPERKKPSNIKNGILKNTGVIKQSSVKVEPSKNINSGMKEVTGLAPQSVRSHGELHKITPDDAIGTNKLNPSSLYLSRCPQYSKVKCVQICGLHQQVNA